MRVLASIFLTGCSLIVGRPEGTFDAGTIDAGKCAMRCAPDGWTPVTIGPCAREFTATSLVTNVTLEPTKVCPCSCTATSPSTCASQTKGYAGDMQCNTPTQWDTSGSCIKSDMTLLGYQRVEKIAGSGGACGRNPKPDDTAIQASSLTVCTAPPQCEGSICEAQKVCGMHDGDVACPNATDVRTVAGADSTVTCACEGSCALEASCDAHMHVYTDDACTQDVVGMGHPIFADDVCKQTDTAKIASYKFDVLPVTICTGSSMPGKGTVSLVGTRTICCPR